MCQLKYNAQSTGSVHGPFILSPSVRLRGHYGWILKKNGKFHLFYFLLNDTRFHLVLDCTCILQLRLTSTVSEIFDAENMNDDLPVLVLSVEQDAYLREFGLSFWHVQL